MESQHEFYEYKRNSSRHDRDDYINKITTMLISYNKLANEEEYYKNFE